MTVTPQLQIPEDISGDVILFPLYWDYSYNCSALKKKKKQQHDYSLVGPVVLQYITVHTWTLAACK